MKESAGRGEADWGGMEVLFGVSSGPLGNDGTKRPAQGF